MTLHAPSDAAAIRPPGYRRSIHLLALFTAVAVFPLIFVGAGVTSTDAGLAYPDWPTSAGHLVNPPQWWRNLATRWEHGHRLIGWIVGMLAIALAIGCWPRRGLVRLLGLGTLLAISLQGILGGLRVTEISTDLAMLHGIWGQACFCLACLTALTTSRTWAIGRGSLELRAGDFLQRLCMVATAAVFLQLVLGAAQRHFSSSVTLTAHVLWAIPVSFLTCWVAMWLADGGGRNLLSRLGKAVGILTAVQLVLGSGAFLVTVIRGTDLAVLHWLLPTAHVAVGALLLALMVVLTVSLHRLVRPAPRRANLAMPAAMAAS